MKQSASRTAESKILNCLRPPTTLFSLVEVSFIFLLGTGEWGMLTHGVARWNIDH